MKATHAHFTVLVATILVSCCFGQEFATRQKSPTTENLRGVSALSNGVAWASGTHGTYLRTLDGGKTWRAAQVPGAETLDFRDVEAFSADVAYLLSAGPGDESRIYNTADGGKNWTLQFTNPDSKGFFDCMAFWNSDQGIALGDPVNGKFELIVTEDGGKNWKPLPRDKFRRRWRAKEHLPQAEAASRLREKTKHGLLQAVKQHGYSIRSIAGKHGRSPRPR